MSNSKRNLLPVLLLAEVGQVVVAKEAVGNAALAHSLLAKHHKPVIDSLKEIRNTCRKVIQKLAN